MRSVSNSLQEFTYVVWWVEFEGCYFPIFVLDERIAAADGCDALYSIC